MQRIVATALGAALVLGACASHDTANLAASGERPRPSIVEDAGGHPPGGDAQIATGVGDRSGSPPGRASSAVSTAEADAARDLGRSVSTHQGGHGPSQDGFEEVAYTDCYEQAVVSPAPYAEVAAWLPDGFRPGSLPGFLGLPQLAVDPGVSGLGSINIRCADREQQVVAQILAVIVEPPEDLRLPGAAWHMFQLDAVVSSQHAAEPYRQWCIPVRVGEPSFAVDERTPLRTGHVGGPGVAEVITAVGGPEQVFAAGTGRMYALDGDRIRITDIAFPDTPMLAGSGTVAFDDAPGPGARVRKGLGVHLYGEDSSNTVTPVVTC